MFFIFESSFLLEIIRPEEAAANAPLTPPRGIAAGRPTNDRAEARLALESTVENTGAGSAPVGGLFGAFIFLCNGPIMGDFCVQSS